MTGRRRAASARKLGRSPDPSSSARGLRLVAVQGTGGKDAGGSDIFRTAVVDALTTTLILHQDDTRADCNTTRRSKMLHMSAGSNETSPADDADEQEADTAAEGDEQDIPLAQPAGSQVAIERFADGVTIKVPPAGLFGGTQGLFVFAILWNGIIGVITAVMLAAFFGKGAKADESVWIAPAILSIFWLVGIGVLLGSINM